MHTINPPMSEDEELERIRRQRLADVQAQQQHGAAEAAEADRRRRELEAQKDAILRAILTPQARERLTRVRIARPDQAEALERQLIALAQSGRLNQQLTDEDVKTILARLFPPKRDISIRRKGAIEE